MSGYQVNVPRGESWGPCAAHRGTVSSSWARMVWFSARDTEGYSVSRGQPPFTSEAVVSTPEAMSQTESRALRVRLCDQLSILRDCIHCVWVLPVRPQQLLGGCPRPWCFGQLPADGVWRTSERWVALVLAWWDRDFEGTRSWRIFCWDQKSTWGCTGLLGLPRATAAVFPVEMSPFMEILSSLNFSGHICSVLLSSPWE